LADRPHSTLLLKNVQVGQGTFIVHGQGLEASAALTPLRCGLWQGIWQARAN